MRATIARGGRTVRGKRQIKDTLARPSRRCKASSDAAGCGQAGSPARARPRARETEEILDLSARTLSTIHARTVARDRSAVDTEVPTKKPESDGLLGLARRLTQRGKRKDEGKSWEMSTLLAAAETNEAKSRLPAGSGGGARCAPGGAGRSRHRSRRDRPTGSGEEEWRRYLAGDRSVFARRLARDRCRRRRPHHGALSREQAIPRRGKRLYRRIRMLLARAREGDGGGLLASSILSADTGKIYLAMAYALGRLS